MWVVPQDPSLLIIIGWEYERSAGIRGATVALSVVNAPLESAARGNAVDFWWGARDRYLRFDKFSRACRIQNGDVERHGDRVYNVLPASTRLGRRIGPVYRAGQRVFPTRIFLSVWSTAGGRRAVTSRYVFVTIVRLAVGDSFWQPGPRTSDRPGNPNS